MTAIDRPANNIVLPVQIHDLLTDLDDSAMFVDSARFRSRWRFTALLAISIGLICGSGLFAAFYETPAESDVAERDMLFPLLMGPVAIAGLIGVVIASVRLILPIVALPFLHLGMIVMGRQAGLQVILLSIGPWMLLRRNGRLERMIHGSIQLDRTGLLLLDSGHGRQTIDDVRAVHSGALIGSFLNIVVVAPLFLGSTWLWLQGPQPFSYLLAFVSILTSVSLVFAMIAGSQALQRVRRLRRSDDQAKALSALAHAGSLSAAGTRPRSFPPDLVHDLAALASSPDVDRYERYLLNYFLYLTDADAGEIDDAGSRLRTALEQIDAIPQKQRDLLLSHAIIEIYDEAAFFYAYHRADAASASGWLFRANQDALVGRCKRLASEAAVLYAVGDHAEARRRAVHSIELRERGTSTGDSSHIADRMRSLIESIDGK